jgi:hypothetical protein
MEVARPFHRLEAEAAGEAAWFVWARQSAPGWASGQVLSAPAADRRAEEAEHRSVVQSLPEALACRQILAAAKASRLARSSAAASARRWAAPAAWVAAAALRSGQTAALRAPEAVEAQPDAGAAGAEEEEEARHAGAAAEAAQVAGVAAEAVAQ